MGKDIMQACQYRVFLIGGNAERWMDCLEVQEEALATLPDFKHMFIDQYAPLDDKKIAWDKLQELR